MGGKYVFRTPHSLRGPHDVSQYFSDEPECFHLKEWTYSEIHRMLKDLKYTNFYTYFRKRGKNLRLPYYYFAACERFLGIMPKRYIRTAAKYLTPILYGAAVK